MSSKPKRPAVEGWFEMDFDHPRLLASACEACGTLSFPRERSFCKNPACDGSAFGTVPLSPRGRIWSYTNACYQPPPPYMAASPYRPFAIAAVELEREGLVVMGQLADGVTVDDVKVGQEVDLVLEKLFEDDEAEYVVWKWKPVSGG